MSDELISRSALLKRRFRMHSEFLGTVSVVAVKDIEEAPAVDAVPVVHGRWKNISGDEWCCSVCGNVKSTEGRWEPMMDNFCSECGADMRGANDENG